MMRATVALLLLLAACGSKTDREANGGGQALPADLEPKAPPPPSEAQLQARAEQALSSVLLSPKDARYSNLRPGSSGAVCGEVDSRQEDGRYGGPRPFVVTPDGVGVVSPAARIMFGNPTDLFPDFYIRWCATPAELTKLGPGIREEEPPAEAQSGNLAELPATPPPEPAVQVPPPDAPAADKKGAAKPLPPEPPVQLKPPTDSGDSFFNAVIRKQE